MADPAKGRASPGDRVAPPAGSSADAQAPRTATHTQTRGGGQDEAERLCREALRANPDDAALLVHGGRLAMMRGDTGTAIERLKHATRIAPEAAAAHAYLASALAAAERLDEAETAVRRSLAIETDHAESWHLLGLVMRRLRRRFEALEAFHRAYALAPTSLEIVAGLAEECNDTGDPESALRLWSEVRRMAPGEPLVPIGIALALGHLGRFDEALAEIDAVTRSVPASVDAWRIAGDIRHWAGRHELAEAAYRRMLALAPGHLAAWKGIAWSQLAQGRWIEGFDALEHRNYGLHGRRRRLAGVPTWDGRALDGTLVIHADLGLGTMIMYARFATALRERVGRIVFLMDGPAASLARLFASVAGVDRVVSDAADLADERPAACASILSLPFHAHAAPPFAADAIPYLAPSAERMTAFRPASGSGVPRVGVAWSVASRNELPYIPLTKSYPASAIAGWAAARPDIEWHLVQPGEPGDPARQGLASVHIREHGAELVDFDATAALVQTLDLVIAPDTSVAHLAGALGKPVWLLYRSGGSWQFGTAGETTPMYPTMRIFRQARARDWSGPIAAVETALRSWAPGTRP